MQSILIIIHAPPYGSERCLSGLRLATALAMIDAGATRLGLSSSLAVVAGGKVDGEGY